MAIVCNYSKGQKPTLAIMLDIDDALRCYPSGKAYLVRCSFVCSFTGLLAFSLLIGDKVRGYFCDVDDIWLSNMYI